MSCAKLRAGLALSSIAVLLLGAACKRNHPPSTPEVTGRVTYRPGDTARLSATATDRDDDSLAYLFAWVDSSSAELSENYPNGVTASGSHVYPEPDTYMVQVRARDSRGAQSDWSSALALRVGFFAPDVPARPAGPDSGVTGDTYRCSTHATSPYGKPVLIEFDWDGSQSGWCPAVASDSPCVGTHVFYLPGTYHIRARAGDTTGPSSAWSDSLAVTVVSHDTTPPAVSIVSPADGGSVRRGLVAIKAVATDDQIVTKVEFSIDGTLVGTDSVAVGDTFSYAWTDTVAQVLNHSFTIVAKAFDAGGNQASATINITFRDDMKWCWQSPVEMGPMWTSALVASNGTVEVVMSASWDELKFFQVRASNGMNLHDAVTKYGEDDFTGGPALCAATGNVIVGGEDGELYALSLTDLSHVWEWPNKSPVESLTYVPWGAPAISGNAIYVGRGQDMDTLFRLYKFTDAGGSVTQAAAYILTGHSVVDAPAIGADGSVYFGTDSGYLIKIDANLTAPIWRAHLLPVGDVHGPIIGGDGTVYCASDSPPALYAVRPGGTIKWTVTLDGVGARPALGQSALFVGTDIGTVYSIDPQTGHVNWQKSFTPGISFNTTPIVAANGYLYIQNDNDVLYCLNQADGTLLWACDCNSYLLGRGRGGNSHRPRKLGLTDYDPNPSITAEGDIIVVGRQALFCVAGDGSQLDAGAPWPKWQKNLLNTGK